jgi:hypothetical protein
VKDAVGHPCIRTPNSKVRSPSAILSL